MEGRGSHQEKHTTPRAISPNTLDEGVPETTIGEYVTVKGELEFDRLLRIDGSFEGRLVSEVIKTRQLLCILAMIVWILKLYTECLFFLFYFILI
jgi:cytoskeletal protein CcmA (bactofilin family)